MKRWGPNLIQYDGMATTSWYDPFREVDHDGAKIEILTRRYCSQREREVETDQATTQRTLWL